MKTSERDLLLVPGNGRVNKKRRYYSLRNALRRAIFDAVDGSPTVIYDTHKGTDVAGAYRAATGYVVRVYSPRRFKQLWSR